MVLGLSNNADNTRNLESVLSGKSSNSYSARLLEFVNVDVLEEVKILEVKIHLIN